ncbi:hypothetical protein [Streptomyces sp. NPDC051211]|uniref:hypothetical protein n=1 Tax=Streptomyces sp. NPDC051211 TaxID=3154643 RepID=UPI00344D310B
MGSEYGLWVEEPARRHRMPDPIRAAAVRAVLIVAVTLTLASITFFLALTGSWLAFPMVLISVGGTIVATWGVLDVWITRQMWKQRHGVVSVPSSTARGRRGHGGAAPSDPRDVAQPGAGAGAGAQAGPQPGVARAGAQAGPQPGGLRRA